MLFPHLFQFFLCPKPSPRPVLAQLAHPHWFLCLWASPTLSTRIGQVPTNYTLQLTICELLSPHK
jgi:hypothetical protein